MRVVLGGSRSLRFLPDTVRNRLDSWISQDIEFLVGDAPGIDSSFQEYLNSRAYKSVVVYTSADSVRSNSGNWETVFVDSGLKSASAARHTVKDRTMIKLGDAGLMMWDQVSIGTATNILDLARQRKDVTVHDSVEDKFFTIEAGLNVDSWLAEHSKVREAAWQRLRTYDNREARRVAKQTSPIFEETLFSPTE